MTPAAVTPAGRKVRSKPRHGSTPAAGGRTTAPKARRTATATARTATARTAAARTATARTAAGQHAPARRSTAPRAPRRVSGPLGGRIREQPAVRVPLAARSAALIRAIPDHALLDRVVRGRAWIPLLGVLLVGIVAMQVEVLKLNAGIGLNLSRSSALQTRNERLRIAVAGEADDQRIESTAARMGMEMAQPAATRFLQRATAADVAKAVANIRTPDAAGFGSSLTAALSGGGVTTVPVVAVATNGSSGG
jgi:hypothetical protein